jgi:hypothetical protein
MLSLVRRRNQDSERTPTDSPVEVRYRTSMKRDKLTDRERLHMLRTFDKVVPRIPVRGACEVIRELKALRQARRSGGRRSMESKCP